MYTFDEILQHFTPIIGKSFEYALYDDMRANFVVTENSIQCGSYIEPVKTKTDVWYMVSDIYWGQGYHSVMYANMQDPKDITLVAVNGSESIKWSGDVKDGRIVDRIQRVHLV